MVTVAAMANTVVMDMARRMLIMLLNDMKRLPLMSVKTMKHSASAMTAAQEARGVLGLPRGFRRDRFWGRLHSNTLL